VLGDFTDRFERYMRDQLQEMIIYGMEPSKVLFGTDWPISSMRSYLEFIEELNIPPADLEKIMFQNAARLFDIPIGGAGASASGLLGWLGRKMGPA
jgi:predicted TIM-barrel fold metal-dependent hydrolase